MRNPLEKWAPQVNPWVPQIAAAFAILVVVCRLGLILSPGEVAAYGEVVVDAMPWAEVMRIEGKGEHLLPEDPFTPLSLRLPAGRYEIHLRHPEVGSVEVCRLEVSAEETTFCRPKFLDFGGEIYFLRSDWWR